MTKNIIRKKRSIRKNISRIETTIQDIQRVVYLPLSRHLYKLRSEKPWKIDIRKPF